MLDGDRTIGGAPSIRPNAVRVPNARRVGTCRSVKYSAGMDTRNRVALGLVVVSVVLFVAAWMLLGSLDPAPQESPRRGVGRVAKRIELPPVRPVPLRSARAEAAQLPDEEVDGVRVTRACKYIVDWQARNVPDFVILDNLQARSQRFEEKDLACLTASGVSPAILRYAEHSPKTPRLREGEKIGVQ